MAGQKFPVTMTKDDQTRVAHTPGDVAQYEWDGFTVSEEQPKSSGRASTSSKKDSE